MTRRHFARGTRPTRRRCGGRALGCGGPRVLESSAVESPPGSGGGGSSGLAAHKPDGPSVVRECARPHPHGPSRSSASLVDHRGWPPPLRSARVEVDRRLSTRRACKAVVALAVAAACPDAHHSTHCVAPGRVPGSSCPWRRAGQVWRGEMTDQKKKNSLTHHPRPTMRRCGRRARAGAPPVPTRPSRPARTARRTSWGPCGA